MVDDQDLRLVPVEGEEGVRTLWEVLGRCYEPPLWMALPDFEGYIRKVAERAETYALFKSDDLIGAVSLYVNDVSQKQAYITQLAIHEEHRGLGYGKVLLEGSCSIARSKGMERIALEVLKGNASARALYEKSGFAYTGEGSSASYLMRRSLL